jgi:hypothetical protein
MNPSGRVLNVGAVSTNGGFRLTRDGDVVELTPLPNSPSFTANIRWQDLPWKSREPKEVEAIDESGKVLRQTPLEKRGGEIHLTTEPDVFAYRLR